MSSPLEPPRFSRFDENIDAWRMLNDLAKDRSFRIRLRRNPIRRTIPNPPPYTRYTLYAYHPDTRRVLESVSGNNFDELARRLLTQAVATGSLKRTP